ncbi:MAG: carbohydrate ABC transporter permease [Planctomycetota bacterium]
MNWLNKLLLFFAIILVIFYSLAPFAWQVTTSLKPRLEVMEAPPTYVPTEVSIENYTEIFETRPFLTYIINSLIVAAGATILALVTGAPAAYALSRLKIRGSCLILKLFLIGALFPHIVYLLPIRELVKTFGLMNNYLSLIVPYAALNLPLVVWLLYSFFKQLPKDIEEAALVDGFSRSGILTKIIIPVSAPALATTAILVFIFAWNEFLFALTFMTRDEFRTVPVGIAMLQGATIYEIPWGQISAAVVLTTLPVVVMVLFLQRRIVQGLTAGTVKG